MLKDKKCPYCNSKFIAREWSDKQYDADQKCFVRTIRWRCRDCKKVFNEERIPTKPFDIWHRLTEMTRFYEE